MSTSDFLAYLAGGLLGLVVGSIFVINWRTKKFIVTAVGIVALALMSCGLSFATHK